MLSDWVVLDSGKYSRAREEVQPCNVGSSLGGDLIEGEGTVEMVGGEAVSGRMVVDSGKGLQMCDSRAPEVVLLCNVRPCLGGGLIVMIAGNGTAEGTEESAGGEAGPR